VSGFGILLFLWRGFLLDQPHITTYYFLAGSPACWVEDMLSAVWLAGGGPDSIIPSLCVVTQSQSIMV
jgi:hypothetical protein